MILIWAAAAVLFLIIELATSGLTSIWFALGALCALLTAALHAPLWLQALWFVLISLLTLLLTRPLAKRYVNDRAQPTNADRVIGMQCVVREPVDNLAGTGTVCVDGKVWAARSATGETLPVGARVAVREIQGVKLIVAPVADA